MKRYICLCFSLLVLLFSDCGKGPATSGEVKYNIIPGEDALPAGTEFSSLLKEYRYIIPETTEESLFSYISKAYIDKGAIYIFDMWGVDKILVFDVETGKFLRSIGSQGRGPNEYASIGGFTLDKARGKVLIADSANKKVLVYDASSGKFESSFVIDFVPGNIEYIDKNTLAFEGGREDPRLTLTDMEGNVLGSYIPYNEKNGGGFANSFSKGDRDEVIFRTAYTDSLWTVTPEGPVFSRFVDFGKDALTWNIFKTFPRSEYTGLIEFDMLDYKTRLGYYAETGTHIWFAYSDKGIPGCVAYNKRTGKVISYSTNLVNDIVFDKMPLLIVASDDNYFIGTNDAFSIVDNIEKTSPGSVPEDLKSLPPDANPVITLVKFK